MKKQEGWEEEAKEWSQFAEGYDFKVYSVTKVPERLDEILQRVKKGIVLNMGTGSTTHLNRELVKQGNIVFASDYNKDMIRVAKSDYYHPNLAYVLTNSRELDFEDEKFDTAISVNSILPPERNQVQDFFNEAYRVLKDGGVFVAFLPSYHNVEEAAENLSIKCELDPKRMRVKDTTGWQCFHTPATIHRNLTSAGFQRYKIEMVMNTAEEELRQFNKLYFPTTGEQREEYLKNPMYLHLVTAFKNL